LQLVRPGYIAFVGTVDAEYYYDRFTFEIDGKLQVWVNNSINRQTFSFP
jgi:tRNA G10  N-methylase Trm11